MKVNKKIKSLLLVAVLTISFGTLVGCSSNSSNSDKGSQEQSNVGYKNISGDEAVKLIEDTKNLLILDVRDAEEYAAGHIKDAINIPVDDVEKRINELENYKDKTVLVYCRVGKRSAQASEVLSKNGFKNVYNAEDGVEEYEYNLVSYMDVNGYEAEKLISDDSDIVILDVREEKEFKSGHIENSINISSEEIADRMDELKGSKDKTVLVYCKSGRRSADTAKLLQENGFAKVYNSIDGVSEYDFNLVK